MNKKFSNLVLSMWLAPLAAAAAGKAPYHAYPLALSLPGAQSCTATALNDSARMVGYCSFVDGSGATIRTRGFITGANGQGTADIGDMGGDYVAALGLNNSAQVVGSANAAPGGFGRAFVTGPEAAGMGFFPISFDVWPASEAWAINDSGLVAGTASVPYDANTIVFVKQPAAAAASFLADGSISGARIAGINAAGQVSGYAEADFCGPAWNPEKIARAGFLTGPSGLGLTWLISDRVTCLPQLSPAGITDAGVIAGTSRASSLENAPGTPFSRSAAGTVTSRSIDGTSITGVEVTAVAQDGSTVGVWSSGGGTGVYFADAAGTTRNASKVVGGLPAGAQLARVAAVNRKNQLLAYDNTGRQYLLCPTKGCAAP